MYITETKNQLSNVITLSDKDIIKGGISSAGYINGLLYTISLVDGVAHIQNTHDEKDLIKISFKEDENDEVYDKILSSRIIRNKIVLISEEKTYIKTGKLSDDGKSNIFSETIQLTAEVGEFEPSENILHRIELEPNKSLIEQTFTHVNYTNIKGITIETIGNVIRFLEPEMIFTSVVSELTAMLHKTKNGLLLAARMCYRVHHPGIIKKEIDILNIDSIAEKFIKNIKTHKDLVLDNVYFISDRLVGIDCYNNENVFTFCLNLLNDSWLELPNTPRDINNWIYDGNGIIIGMQFNDDPYTYIFKEDALYKIVLDGDLSDKKMDIFDGELYIFE